MNCKVFLLVYVFTGMLFLECVGVAEPEDSQEAYRHDSTTLMSVNSERLKDEYEMRVVKNTIALADSFKVICDTTLSVTQCAKCNIDYIVIVEQNIAMLTCIDLQNFLCSFSEDCVNNIEFSEYANEVLFLVLNRYPEDFVRVFDSVSRDSREMILNELKSPVNDNIDISLTILNVDKIYNFTGTKKEIMSALKIAETKY